MTTQSETPNKIPLFKVFMVQNIDSVKDTLTSGMITQSKKVDEFEAKLQEWFNYPYILTLSSATAGLTLAVRLLNLPMGSEIFCTPLTCMATTCAVLENRMKIRWVDVDPETCNMDLDDLRRKIAGSTSENKAIVFVHWAGNPIDLDKLKKVAGSIPIIEDCAHSLGATYNNTKLGTHGNLAVYSLQAVKHLTTGDGGLIFLPNKELYDRAKLLRWFGVSREAPAIPKLDYRLEDDIPEWGYKFHMNDINATIGLCNLPWMNKIIESHKRNGKYYEKELRFLPGIELLKQVDNSSSAYWIFTIKVQNKHRFLKHMTEKGITVSQVHGRNDVHSCVKQYKSFLPQMDALEREIISIPCGWWLTSKELEYIVECIREFSKEYVKIIELQKSDLLTTGYSRELTLNDKESYLKLLSGLNKMSEPVEDSKFISVLRQMNTFIFVYIVNGVMVSTAKIFIEPKFYNNVGHIEDVITDINYRGKGYASKLIRQCIELAKTKDCYKIVLYSSLDNSTFYEKNGFSKKGCEMCLYTSSGKTEHSKDTSNKTVENEPESRYPILKSNLKS